MPSIFVKIVPSQFGRFFLYLGDAFKNFLVVRYMSKWEKLLIKKLKAILHYLLLAYGRL